MENFQTIPLIPNSLNFTVKHTNVYNQNISIRFLSKCWQIRANDGYSPIVKRVFADIFLDITNPEKGVRQTTRMLSGRPCPNMVAINRTTTLIKGKYYLYNPDIQISNPSWETFATGTKLIYSVIEKDPNKDENFRKLFLEFANS